MTPFKTYTENMQRKYIPWDESWTPCDVLSLRSPPTMKGGDLGIPFVEDLRNLKYMLNFEIDGSNKQTIAFLDGLIEWIAGTRDQQKHAAMSKYLIDVIASCPSRAGWTKFSGKLYRGLVKDSKDFLSNFTYKGVERMPFRGVNKMHMVVGTYNYKSDLLAQSWAKDPKPAGFFATQSRTVSGYFNVGFVLERGQSRGDDTFSLKYLGNKEENEVVVIGSKPMTLNCYVPLVDPLHSRANHDIVDDDSMKINLKVWELIPQNLRLKIQGINL